MAIDPRHIELSPEMKQALAKKAEQSGLPWTEVLTEALRMFRPSQNPQRVVSSSRSFYDAVMEDGAIGVVNEFGPVTGVANSLSQPGEGIHDGDDRELPLLGSGLDGLPRQLTTNSTFGQNLGHLFGVLTATEERGQGRTLGKSL